MIKQQSHGGSRSENGKQARLGAQIKVSAEHDGLEELGACLLSLPEEVLHAILATLDVKDLLKTMQTCSYLLSIGLAHIDILYSKDGDMPARAWHRFHAATKLVVKVSASDTCTTDAASTALVMTTCNIPARLTQLSIDIQSIDSDIVLALARALQGHQHLRKLCISTAKLIFSEVAMFVQAGMPELNEMCTTVDVGRGYCTLMKTDTPEQFAAELRGTAKLLADVRASVVTQLGDAEYFQEFRESTIDALSTQVQADFMTAAAIVDYHWIKSEIEEHEQEALPVVVELNGCKLHLELHSLSPHELNDASSE